MFASEGNNKDVVFADINLSEAPIRGAPHSPGAGGWPTIRYFNKETGLDGGSYVKKTSESMCAELGDLNNMMDYVEGYGNTTLCRVDGETKCSEKEEAYIQKMKEEGAEAQEKQTTRLETMVQGLEGDLQGWAIRRLRILKQLLADSTDGRAAGDEL
mmetsp:Transcript_32310/g.53417  ORF Transcript_32310/g.53417 Transcript_32310/m.53417 type:complete len:157 (+) Transcript_32310:348-818(+)